MEVICVSILYLLEGKGCIKKRMPLCNAKDKFSYKIILFYMKTNLKRCRLNTGVKFFNKSVLWNLYKKRILLYFMVYSYIIFLYDFTWINE